MECERTHRVHVPELRRVPFYVPGIREIAILRFERRAIRQKILHAHAESVTRARVGVQLGLETETARNRRVRISHRAVRVIQESLVRYDLVIQRCDQVASQDLCQADAILLPIGIALEQGVVGASDRVVAERIAQR